MYYYISGKIAVIDPTFVVLDVGGLGYEIKISLNTYSEIKSVGSCKLFTYFHVKEDIQALYGFLTEEDKLLFMRLIGVSGIGPSTGLMIFSSLSTMEIKEAIVGGNSRVIQSVKGIGAKTAQRLILELKDKIQLDEASMAAVNASGTGAGGSQHLKTEALAALVTLGIPKTAAEKNINSVLKKYGSDIKLEDLIKHSLKTL